MVRASLPAAHIEIKLQPELQQKTVCQMAPPLYVKAISVFASVAMIAATMASQGMISSAGPFALPAFEGGEPVAALVGALITIISASKTTTIMYEGEGTFLRRNLMIVYGSANMYIAFTFIKHFPGSNAIVGLLALEGLIYLADGIGRKRTPKEGKKGN